jgi:hypothetical protein
MSDGHTLPFTGPGPVYENLDLWAPLLFHEAVQRGEQMIRGKTFRNCRIQGPALIVPMENCQFDGCDLGRSDGNVLNLMYQPLGPALLTGGIPFRDCVFENCKFMAIGFTGGTDFIDMMRGVQT